MADGHVVMIGAATADRRGAEVGTVTMVEGDLPPVPEVKDEDLDVLRAIVAGVAGDDEAIGRALAVDVEKRRQMMAAIEYVPDEKVREELRATIDKGLGDKNARDAILAARPYHAKLLKLTREFSIDFERVEEHGRGVRLAARWTFYDAIQGRDFPAEQFAYPRGSIGKVAEIAEFVRSTCEALATRAFHESVGQP